MHITTEFAAEDSFYILLRPQMNHVSRSDFGGMKVNLIIGS